MKEKKLVLDIEDLSFSYEKNNPIFICADIKLNIGEKCMLLSPRGGGKSTLLRLVSGVERKKYYGNISILDNDVEESKNIFKNVVFISEKPVLLNSKTIKKNIIWAKKILGVDTFNMSSVSPDFENLFKEYKSVKAKNLPYNKKVLLEKERAKLKDIRLLLIDRSIENINEELIKEKNIKTHQVMSEIKSCFSSLQLSSESVIIACETKKEIEFYNAQNYSVIYASNGKLHHFSNLKTFEQNVFEVDMMNYLDGYDSRLVCLKNIDGDWCFLVTNFKTKNDLLSSIEDYNKNRKNKHKNNEKMIKNGQNTINYEENVEIYNYKISLKNNKKLMDKLFQEGLFIEDYFVVFKKFDNDGYADFSNLNDAMIFVNSTRERII